MSGAARGQRGMTVIELMIAMVILSVVVAAAFSVSYSIMNSYREHRRSIGVERSARGAMSVLVDAVRNSSPAVPNGQIVDLVGCELATAWHGIRVDNDSAGPDAIDLVYSKGGVVTSLRAPFSDSSNVMVVEDGEPGGVPLVPGDQILVTDFATGHVMTIESIAQAGADWNLTLRNGTPQTMCAAPPAPFTYPARAMVLRVQKARFFVGATAPVMMMDPDGTPGPVPLPEEAVAEGVEDLQIAIGVDLNGNGGIDPEVGAAGNDDEWFYNHPDDADPPPIGTVPFRAIRLTVIARSTDDTSNVATSLRPGAEDRAAATVADVARRRSLSTIVELRNLEGSP
jgi:prepilin-type N-terminal cleavage/methylation domain-containing protein